MRAGLAFGEKVPNPKRDTLFPDRVSAMTVSRTASTARSAVRFSTSAAAATRSTSSLLFTNTSGADGEVPENQRGFVKQGQAFLLLLNAFPSRANYIVSRCKFPRIDKFSLICKAFFTMAPLEDGSYDAFIVDAEVREDRDAMRLELTITSGA